MRGKTAGQRAFRGIPPAYGKSGDRTRPTGRLTRALTAAAANGSNRIALMYLPLPGIGSLTCRNDPYRPSCHSFASRGSPRNGVKSLLTLNPRFQLTASSVTYRTVALSKRRWSIDASVSMSSASDREVAQRTLGAWAVGLRKVENKPFMSMAIPACSDRSHSVARLLKASRGPDLTEHVASTKAEPSPSVRVLSRILSATLFEASSTA